MSNSGTAENIIRKNRFRNLNYGIYAIGKNANDRNTSRIPGLQFECNSFNGCYNDIAVKRGAIRGKQGSASYGADNEFIRTQNSSIELTYADNIPYYHSNDTWYAPYNPSTGVTVNSMASTNACSSSLCGIPPRNGESALAQYWMMAEEYADLAGALSDTIGNRPGDPQDTDTAALQMRLSELSAAMGDLARTSIRAILSDTVVDMGLLKEWYGAIVETRLIASLQTIPPPVFASTPTPQTPPSPWNPTAPSAKSPSMT